MTQKRNPLATHNKKMENNSPSSHNGTMESQGIFVFRSKSTSSGRKIPRVVVGKALKDWGVVAPVLQTEDSKVLTICGLQPGLWPMTNTSSSVVPRLGSSKKKRKLSEGRAIGPEVELAAGKELIHPPVTKDSLSPGIPYSQYIASKTSNGENGNVVVDDITCTLFQSDGVNATDTTDTALLVSSSSAEASVTGIEEGEVPCSNDKVNVSKNELNSGRQKALGVLRLTRSGKFNVEKALKYTWRGHKRVMNHLYSLSKAGNLVENEEEVINTAIEVMTLAWNQKLESKRKKAREKQSIKFSKSVENKRGQFEYRQSTSNVNRDGENAFTRKNRKVRKTIRSSSDERKFDLRGGRYGSNSRKHLPKSNRDRAYVLRNRVC
eukprot:g5443.t1